MPKLSVSEAKAHFSEVMEKVMQGEEFVLSDQGKDIARIVPIPVSGGRPLGLLAHLVTPEEVEAFTQALLSPDPEQLDLWHKSEVFPT